jgi:hypothetical protein
LIVFLFIFTYEKCKDDQGGLSNHIYEALKEIPGGDWVVIAIPKGNSNYKASFPTAISNFN